jgi:uncharacterized membrane protein YhaH (DUF805 family)
MLSIPLSPSGRLKPRPFIYGAGAVYLSGVASHVLTLPDVITRAWLWPFVIIQAVLVWIWYVLHARRLHDAGRSSGLAAGAAMLYVLSIVLLLIVGSGFVNSPMSNPGAGAALNLILVLYIIANLLGSLQFDFAWALIAILTVLALLPVIVAISVTLWAVTRPSVGENRP